LITKQLVYNLINAQAA